MHRTNFENDLPTPVLGILLAGGLARRMGGGDKCLQPIAGRPMLEHVIVRARPQTAALVINAGGNVNRFADFGLPVVPDVIEGFAGPLAGVLTGMLWARDNAPRCRWVVSIATDTPLLPIDLVTRFLAAVDTGDTDLVCASSGGRAHPVFGLWPVRLAEDLRSALVDEGMRKIDAWTARFRLKSVAFDDRAYDPFFNVNTPADLETATRLMGFADPN